MFSRWLKIASKRSILLIGPRRAGKTTYLRSQYPEYTYATLDDYDYLSWAKSDPKGFVGHLGPHAIIYEIQRHPPLTIAAKYSIDNEKAHILMSGSSTLGLLDIATDTMAGRIDIVSLTTACWGEEDGAPTHDIFDEQASPSQLAEAMRRLPVALAFGQFPEILTSLSESQKKELLRNYRDTYFLRDLMQLASLENSDGLRGVFLHLARSLGSHLEVSSLAREAGLSFPTTRKYLNALAQSHLVFRLPGFQYGSAKRHIKSSKSYFADVGILQSLNAGPSQGQVLENFVLAEIEKRRKLGFIQSEQLFFYKSPGGLEVDAVWETPKGLMAAEIKSSIRIGPSDVRRLREFASRNGRNCRAYLFYLGSKYGVLDNVRLIPIAALYRGG